MNLYQIEILGDEPGRDYSTLLSHPKKFSPEEFNVMLTRCTASATRKVIAWAADEDCMSDLSNFVDALTIEMKDQFGFEPTAPAYVATIAHDTPIQLRCGGESGFKGSPAKVRDCNPESRQHPIYMLFLRFLAILLKQPY